MGEVWVTCMANAWGTFEVFDQFTVYPNMSCDVTPDYRAV